jgi:hypothetical protein
MKYLLEHCGELPRLVFVGENNDETSELINFWMEKTGFVPRSASVPTDEVNNNHAR